MISNLPFYINVAFILTTGLSVFLFYKATRASVTTLVIIGLWLMIQAVISYTGFYTVTDTFPPRFALLALPALFFILLLFITAKGRAFLNSLDIKMLTLLHIVRIPVEICLYWLFLHKSIPGLMTFEERNFDILAGLTAPVVYYFGFVKPVLSKNILLLWNIFCLGLLLNIVVHAVLSAPSAFQQLAFEQPNTAIFYFPFVWLPCCVVPLVLLSHFAAVRILTARS